MESAIYRPFGEQSEWLLPGNPSPETKGWIGERYDADAGLQYLNARYYDPALGLFLQPDWFEVTKPGVGTNRFSYSFNDPVNKIDPGGNLTYDSKGDQFSADEDDTVSTIADSLGLDPDDIVDANPDLSTSGSIVAGTVIAVPRNERINAAISAIREIGSTAYAQGANYSAQFPSGTNKCNVFVSDMIRSGYGVAPTHVRVSLIESMIAGYGVAIGPSLKEGPATAAQWSRASKPGMTSVSEEDAVFGDIAASDNGAAGSIPGVGASGHTTVFTGDVAVVDLNGKLHSPVGGWGTVGAGTDTVNYRDRNYLESHGYEMSFTHYE